MTHKLIKENAALIAWAAAFFATTGSLFFSEILKWPPCILCWYQRIFMYPLVLIIGIGIWKKDRVMPLYALTLAGIGGLIALFHSLLQWKIIPDAVAPCAQGVSCTTVHIKLLGFITIPSMSLGAFIIILASMWVVYKESK